MFILALFCLGLFTAVFYPNTPVGTYLRGVLIEAPARLLSKITWAKSIVSVLLPAFFLGALLLGFNMHDGVVVFMMLPEVLVWLAAFDIATLLELSIFVIFAATSIRFDVLARFVSVKAAKVFASRPLSWAMSPRKKRAKRQRPDSGVSDDDASAPWRGFAFA